MSFFTWPHTSGQLGDGTTTRSVLGKVLGLSGVTAIDAGSPTAWPCLRRGGAGLGEQRAGQLGDGTVTNHATPIGVRNLGTGAAIAAGANHSLVARRDGPFAAEATTATVN